MHGAAAGFPRLSIRFFRTAMAREPVRDWLVGRPREDRRIIGEDLKTVQYAWPLGMPLVRKIEPGLWEVRSTVSDGAVRILFTVDGELMLLLHAFSKKSQRIPLPDLEVARRRLAEAQGREAP